MPLDRLDSVVFFNGYGQEREIWERHTGGQLTGRFIEGPQASLPWKAGFRQALVRCTSEASIHATATTPPNRGQPVQRPG